MSRVAVEIGPVQPGDIDELAAGLRAGDRTELDALGMPDHRRAVELSVRGSTHCWAARGDGRILCIFGAAPTSVLHREAAPWLLATDDMVHQSRAVMALPAPYIQAMLRDYGTLHNVVHAANSRAVRWLRYLGFTLGPAHPWGVRGEMFHSFHMTA